MIQIFMHPKSQDSKKALRWFSERRIPVQEVNLKEKELSAGELESIVSCIARREGGRDAAVEQLIDKKSKEYASIAYLEDSQKLEKLLENPALLTLPLCRNGKTDATCGVTPDIWESWR